MSPLFEFSSVLCIRATQSANKQELMIEAMQQNYESHVFDVKRTLAISNLTISYNNQSIELSFQFVKLCKW